MRLKLFLAFAVVAFAARLTPAEEPIPAGLDYRSAIFSPALPLAETMRVHGIYLTTEQGDDGRVVGQLELDPNVPAYDEFGDLKAGERQPLVKLVCTLKLVKQSEDGRRLYKIEGPKITSQLYLAINIEGLSQGRLLVHGRDGKVQSVVALTQRQVLLEPCHPGCFPAGTQVRLPKGSLPIEDVVVGDSVLTIDPKGKPATCKVEDIFVTRNRLLEVRTSNGVLKTTVTQPLCLAAGGFKAAGELKPGDKIWQWRKDERQAVTVKEVSVPGKEVKVFNLVLGDSIVFVAGDFLARSKPPLPAP